MAASKCLSKQLEDIDKCPICHDSFTDPRTLPCIHTFCCQCISQCIARKQPNDQMRCPMCRMDFIVPYGGGAGLPKNIFVSQMSELRKLSSTIAEEMACEACEKEASVVSLCTTCVQKLCNECCETHKRIRTTRNHRLFSLRRSKDESVEMAKLLRSYCKVHEERILEMYCYECGDIICLLCHAINHCGHECTHVDEIADERRQQLGEDTKALAMMIGADKFLLAETGEHFKKL